MEKVYKSNVPDIFYYVWISSKNSLLHVHMNLGNVHVRVCGAAVTWFLNFFFLKAFGFQQTTIVLSASMACINF